MASRGLYGSTPEELRASRVGFWDEAFTTVVVRSLDTVPSKLVDVGCGLATAAHALLPRCSSVSYVGVDSDAERSARARESLDGTSYSDRVELRIGRAEQLPCESCEADAVLVAMTLQHLRDPGAALCECARVLAPRGRLVAIEPDNLVNRFYFDDVNAARVFPPISLSALPCRAGLKRPGSPSLIAFRTRSDT